MVSESSPILFAHRGARADATENTMEAFELAASWGATGIETDAWLTADRVAILDHDGKVRRRRFSRRSPIVSVHRNDLPSHIPTFAELFDSLGHSHHLSIDLKDPGVWRPIVDHVRAIDPQRLRCVWLCSPDHRLLTTIRSADDDVRLVHSTRADNLQTTTESWARQLADDRVDAINLRQPDWTPGMVTGFKKFDLRCFMWDVQTPRDLAHAFDIGVDAVYSDHVRRMVAAATESRRR